jgi:hypothetical protein
LQEKNTDEQVPESALSQEEAVEEKIEGPTQPQGEAPRDKALEPEGERYNERQEVNSIPLGDMDRQALYSGEVELIIASQVELNLVSVLYNYLQTVPELRVLHTRGSWDQGTSITIVLKNAMPLIDILLKTPDVDVFPELLGKDVISTGKVGSLFGGTKKEVLKIRLTLKEVTGT